MSMKGETQAVHLSKMMKRQKHYPEYELVLSFVQIKRSKLKKLSQNDLILLGLEKLEIFLISKEKICATASIRQEKNSTKIEIINSEEYAIHTNDSKKYEVIKCSFGTVQSRTIEVGHKIDISSLRLDKVSLIIENETLAKASLVNVDDEIAIEITKVNTDGK
jgi:hypothetical protein